MVKATRTSAVLLGLVTLSLIGSSTPAFAEVQNVKVGGDVTTRGFWRQNMDLHDADGTLDNKDRFWMMTTGLNVGADLTENVAAFIRMSNQRDWNQDSAAGNLALSQAYVRLKELFYSPLTVTLGRQPIVWGRGFVLGSGLIPNTVLSGWPTGNTSADEFTDYTAFDAVRATLDFAGAAAVDMPLSVDAVYIKLDENTIGVGDDVNLAGINVGTKLDAANSEVEAYWLNKRDKSTTGTAASNSGSVNTVGVRGSAAPAEGVSVYAEVAYQFGKRATDPTGVNSIGDSQQAWAFDLGADYTLADVAMTPKVGAEWIFFSGKENQGATPGWDPIARGYFTTPIREFQAVGFYPVDQTCHVNNAEGGVCTGAVTNQHQLSLYGSVKPIEDLTVAPRLSWFFADEGLLPHGRGGVTRHAGRQYFIGTEFDTVLTYNYTDDVQFGVIYGVFKPGTVFREGFSSTAQELVTTVGVKF